MVSMKNYQEQEFKDMKLHQEQEFKNMNRGLSWINKVAEKASATAAEGLQKIEQVKAIQETTLQQFNECSLRMERSVKQSEDSRVRFVLRRAHMCAMLIFSRQHIQDVVMQTTYQVYQRGTHPYAAAK